MADDTETKSPDVSPTGAPLLGQRALRILLVIQAVVIASAGGAAAMYGTESALTKGLGLAVLALASFLGAVSPGMRKQG